MAPPDDDGFLSRWSRRKVQARSGQPAPASAVTAPAAVPQDAVPVDVPAPRVEETGQGDAQDGQGAPAAPPPTLEDVQALGRESDYSRFVAREVDPTVKNAALKKLFSDPHFNVMDGLDVYIDDYGKPDPLPPAMLREMVQSAALGLFGPEEAPPAEARPSHHSAPPPAGDPAATPSAAPSPPAPDEDPDLRLQRDDAAGRPGAEPGPDTQPGREP